VAPNGNITTSTGPSIAPERVSARSDPAKGQASLRRYQSALKKLDREIKKTETSLASKRARLRAEKSAPIKMGRSSGSGKTRNLQSQLQNQIEELQIKLKQLRKERLDVYDSGKKAGFLPGELEERGLIP
jgi:predicted  nucleic acid-binding Zn-ribbon protein